jgi:hypothetical protein
LIRPQKNNSVVVAEADAEDVVDAAAGAAGTDQAGPV